MCYPLSNLTSSGMALKLGTVEYPPQASFEAKISFYSLHWPGPFGFLPRAVLCLNHRLTTTSTQWCLVPQSVGVHCHGLCSVLQVPFTSIHYWINVEGQFHLKFDFTAKCVNLNGVPWSYMLRDVIFQNGLHGRPEPMYIPRGFILQIDSQDVSWDTRGPQNWRTEKGLLSFLTRTYLLLIWNNVDNIQPIHKELFNAP